MDENAPEGGFRSPAAESKEESLLKKAVRENADAQAAKSDQMLLLNLEKALNDEKERLELKKYKIMEDRLAGVDVSEREAAFQKELEAYRERYMEVKKLKSETKEKVDSVTDWREKTRQNVVAMVTKEREDLLAAARKAAEERQRQLELEREEAGRVRNANNYERLRGEWRGAVDGDFEHAIANMTVFRPDGTLTDYRMKATGGRQAWTVDSEGRWQIEGNTLYMWDGDVSFVGELRDGWIDGTNRNPNSPLGSWRVVFQRQ
jgi:hypothetical protein